MGRLSSGGFSRAPCPLRLSVVIRPHLHNLVMKVMLRLYLDPEPRTIFGLHYQLCSIISISHAHSSAPQLLSSYIDQRSAIYPRERRPRVRFGRGVCAMIAYPVRARLAGYEGRVMHTIQCARCIGADRVVAGYLILALGFCVFSYVDVYLRRALCL